MIAVYAKIDGELAQWEVDCVDTNEAIAAVKAALPADFVCAVLARVK